VRLAHEITFQGNRSLALRTRSYTHAMPCTNEISPCTGHSVLVVLDCG